MVFECFNCHAAENLYKWVFNWWFARCRQFACIDLTRVLRSFLLCRAPQSAEMRQKWMELFPEGDETIFSDSFRLCAEHFDNKYILPGGILSARAVPTKFLVHNVWWVSILFLLVKLLESQSLIEIQFLLLEIYYLMKGLLALIWG